MKRLFLYRKKEKKKKRKRQQRQENRLHSLEYVNTKGETVPKNIPQLMED